MEKGIREQIERIKVKADLFLNENIKAFIKDVQNNIYFCEILLVGESSLLIYNFTGKRMGEKTKLFWSDIVLFEEYREEIE